MSHQLDNAPVPTKINIVTVFNQDIERLKEIAHLIRKEQNRIARSNREIKLLKDERSKIWKRKTS